MKENLLNLAKEIDFQEVQEAQTKEVGPRGTHQGTSSFRYSRFKIKNPKSSKRKGHSYLQRSAHKTIS